MRRTLAVAVLLASSCHAGGRPAVHRAPVARAVVSPPRELPIEISEAPPFRLTHAFEPAAYRVRIALAETRFAGHVDITGDVRDSVPVLWLHGVDLHVSHAVARDDQGHEVPLAFSAPRADQTLGFRPPTALALGRWTLAIDYEGPIRDVGPPQHTMYGSIAPAIGVFRRIVDGKTYVYTQGEAIGARRIVPCIDEPDRKVPWQLVLDVRAGLVAASNTPIASETPIDRDHVRVTFAPTPPLPSYLLAFAVGPFAVVEAQHAGVPVRVLALAGRAPQVATAVQAAPLLLDKLVAWLDVDYPYAKLDVVEVADLGFGAMENPGLVTIDRNALETQPQSILAHEFAHQWFGDLVTPAWWNDVWLSESFASLLSDEVTRSTPHDDVALRLDALAGLGDTRRELTTNGELDGLGFDSWRQTGAGVALLEDVEAYLGTDAFRVALRAYLTAHAHGVVTVPDLESALGAQSSTPIRPLLDELVTGALPRIGFELGCRGAPVVHVTGLDVDMPVCVAFERGGHRAETCATVSAAHPDFALPGHACPRWLMPMPGARTLYDAALPRPMLAALLDHGWPALTADERRLLYAEATEIEDRARMFVRIVATAPPFDREREARFIQDLAPRIEPALRPQFDAWIRARFAFDPHRISANNISIDLASVTALVIARDPDTLRALHDIEPMTHPMGPFSVPSMIAAAVDPARLDALLAELADSKTHPYRRTLIADALGNTPDVIAGIARHPDLLDQLQPTDLHVLLSHVCAPQERDVLRRVVHDPKLLSRIFPAIDACIAERARLAPLIRAWLTALPTARSGS